MGQSFSAEPVVEKHTETGKNETYDAAVSSCQGWRFSQEDDHSLILDLPGEHKASFFAVFDGHGSAIVSKHAAESLWRHISQNELYTKGDFKEALEQSFLSFDREVFESYNAQLAGTTATSVLIVDNVIYCANIGDSRSVASVNCECVPLSHDHKPENPLELKRILAAGGYVLGNRVNGNLALSRAFGDFHYKSNEQLPADQQIVSPFPEIERIELNDDVDFIVLACDGIWDVLTSEEVVEFVISRLEREVRPENICEQLTTRCLATDYELVIGCDNMTVLLVCYTRGRTWSQYCTDIFEKNSKKLGLPNRTRVLDETYGNDTTTFQHPSQRYEDVTTRLSGDHASMASIQTTQSGSSEIDATQSGSIETDATQNTADNTTVDRQRKVLDAARHGMDELIHLLQTGRLPESPQIFGSTETKDAEQGVTEDKPSPSSSAPEPASAKDDASGKDLNDDTQTTSTNITTTEPEGQKREESRPQSNEDEVVAISSGTAEIKLDDVVSEENLPDMNDIDPNEPLASSQEDEGHGKTDEVEGQQQSVEIELSAPDDGVDLSEDLEASGDRQAEDSSSNPQPEQTPQDECSNEASQDDDDTTNTTTNDDDDS